MNVRLVVSPILILLLSNYAPGQQMSQGSGEISPTVRASASAQVAFKQDLMHRIVIAEASVRQAESAHATGVELGRLYGQLGLLYEDAAQWERSEATLEHAVSLLRHTAESSRDLATALSQLGSLH